MYYKFKSLFSGIGEFEFGIKKANLDWSCIGFSEIHKPSIYVYKKHFPDHHHFGDITKVDPTQIQNFDILVGGFPSCQSYSLAVKREGLEDPRGKLFFEILKIVNSKKRNVFF